MSTLAVPLDKALMTELEALGREQHMEPAALAAEAIRKYVAAEQARSALASTELISLYEDMSGEDLDLAESGMPDYQRLLGEADGMRAL